MLGPHKADPNYETEAKRREKQAKENGGVTDWGVVNSTQPPEAPKADKKTKE